MSEELRKAWKELIDLLIKELRLEQITRWLNNKLKGRR